MFNDNNEYECLCILEEKLLRHLDVIDKLIENTYNNINNLNEYINKKYNEIKILASKKPTRINWMKCDDKTHMSLFFDKKIGFIPSNEDALKILDSQLMLSNYRKKYEYKKNSWTKKDIDKLFETVDIILKKYACYYLIDENLSCDEKINKKKIIEQSEAKQIFSQIKLFFDKYNQENIPNKENDDKISDNINKNIYDNVNDNINKNIYDNENDNINKNIYDNVNDNINKNIYNSINNKGEKKNIITHVPNDDESIDKEHDESNKIFSYIKNDKKIEHNFLYFSETFWNEVSEKLSNNQNAKECQKMWLYYGCFEDDKQKKWTKDEIDKLLCLSKKYEQRNWKCIARELNTNRSPLSCFEQYIKIKKLYENKEKVKLERIAFNVLEDIQLQILVSIIGDKNWAEIKKHMESLNSNTSRIKKRKTNLNFFEKEKQKKFLNDEISYKRRYLRLISSTNNMEQ
ncbi:transcription factor MYB1 [Plasmodium sp. gorilla clade G2]|uniref:transcription factor MYB1 n=1 Tax=Plasmodium sp. gorilla clade G2 TaxID=880535 RepID=UPI000D20E957|nr:transcription factor MYB1 [Plasmodium sp. gorilla clade G2]SOV17595.1 transcription factor MYB1 [Plasmodium sp. gorilla clade G2]